MLLVISIPLVLLVRLRLSRVDAAGNVIYDKAGNPLPMYFDYGGVNYRFEGGALSTKISTTMVKSTNLTSFTWVLPILNSTVVLV